MGDFETSEVTVLCLKWKFSHSQMFAPRFIPQNATCLGCELLRQRKATHMAGKWETFLSGQSQTSLHRRAFEQPGLVQANLHVVQWKRR